MLGIKGKRVLLSLHILLNSIWLGGTATILFFNLYNRMTGGANNPFTVDQLVFRFHDILLMNLAFAVILTGMSFSLFTKWGFLIFTGSSSSGLVL